MDLILKGWTKQFQQDQGLPTLNEAEAFETFAGYCVLSSCYEDEFNPDQFRMGAGGDLGIDVAGIVVNGDLLSEVADVRDAVDKAKHLDVHFVVVQAKTSAKFETKVFTDLADNLVQIFTAERMTYQSSPDVQNFRACVEAIYADVSKLTQALPRLSVAYVSSGNLVGDALLEAKRAAAAKRLEDSNRFERIDVRAIGVKELRELYKRATQAVAASFAMPKRITLPKTPGVDQAFLGVLPATELVDRVLTDSAGGIRKMLFYENVRDFQDYNPVNVEIRDTLRDEQRRDRFVVLNNGITVVAREVTPVGDDIHVRDFQIVNGCQTCHVLFDERAVLTDRVHVAVRLIESRDEDVIGGVIAATNRQTAVTEDDLAAREHFHKELEDFFAAQHPNRQLFYERRSKQYATQQNVNKTRVISRSQLTKAYAAMFLGEPARASRYVELKAARKDDLFRPGQHSLAYYAAAATYYRMEWLFRNRKIDRSYGPARYHLLAAVKWSLLGDRTLPSQPKAAAAECQKIIDKMWSPVAAEDLLNRLLPALDAALRADARVVLLSDAVRTQRFADRFRREVLGPGE
jgi:hypothetical protein